MEVLLESEEQMARSSGKEGRESVNVPTALRHRCQQPWRSKRGGC